MASAAAGFIAASCFVVGPQSGASAAVGMASPTLTTTSAPASASVGAQLQDSADLEGGDAPTGTITFTLTDPNGKVIDTEPVTVSSGNGMYSTSTGGTATMVGAYEWTASYDGDANNSSIDSSPEQVAVGMAMPTVTTTVDDASNNAPWAGSEKTGASAYDTSAVTGVAGVAPSGTISYTLWSNGTCASTGTGAGTGLALGTKSSTEGPLSAGSYSFEVTYSGDGNYSKTSSSCEPFTVTASTPTVTTAVDDASNNAPWSGNEKTGASAYDTSTVTGVAGVAPTGTISYTFWGNGTCANTGTAAGTGLVLGTKSSTEGPLSTGSYSFEVTYSGDSNYSKTSSTCEPFTVAMATATVKTTVDDAGNNAPWSGHETAGASADDTATVAGAGGFTPSGTAKYTFFMDVGCTGSGSTTQTVTLGAGNVPRSNATAALGAGSYSFQLTYSGDRNYVGSMGPCEPFIVAKGAPTVSTVASPTTGKVGVAIKAFKDTATLAGSNVAPTGSVNFTLYSNSACSTAVSGVSGSGTISSSSGSYSTTWTPSAAGTYYWIAKYAGDANNSAVAETCGTEKVVITAQPSIATTADPKFGATGTTLQDSATLANTSILLGTASVTFKLYGPNDSTCATVIHSETVGAVRTNGPFNTTTGYVARSSGTYQWIASFSGDSNNGAVSSSCGAEPVTVSPVGSQLSQITPAATTCAQFASGFATSLSAMQYTLSGTKVRTVSPSTFTYWVKVTATGTYTITQSVSETSKKLLLSPGSGVYDNATGSTCTTVGSTITHKATSGTVTVKITSGSGPFYIGLNFSTSKIVGEAAPAPSTTVQYLYSAGAGGTTSEIDLKG